MRSQKPPCHGALSMMKSQVTPLLIKYCWISLARTIRLTSCAALLNVFALSYNIRACNPRRAANRRKACKNVDTVKLGTNSRCTALVEAQVQRHTYALLVLSVSFCDRSVTKSGPAKSTPVFVNGGESLTRLAGKGAALGVLNAFPSSFLQITHRLTMRFTASRPLTIQYFSRMLYLTFPLFRYDERPCDDHNKVSKRMFRRKEYRLLLRQGQRRFINSLIHHSTTTNDVFLIFKQI